jgi:hypothetical protein
MARASLGSVLSMQQALNTEGVHMDDINKHSAQHTMGDQALVAPLRVVMRETNMCNSWPAV